MRVEFSKKRLLSIFRYCFGNVSGLFRDWCSFYKPNFRPEISRNHAPGFLISKDTKKLRETWDIIYMIAKICYRFSPIFSIFLCFSLNFSTYLGFSSYLCTRNSAARKKGGGVIIFKKVLKNDAALPSEIDSRAFFVGDQRWNRWGWG